MGINYLICPTNGVIAQSTTTINAVRAGNLNAAILDCDNSASCVGLNAGSRGPLLLDDTASNVSQSVVDGE